MRPQLCSCDIIKTCTLSISLSSHFISAWSSNVNFTESRLLRRFMAEVTDSKQPCHRSYLCHANPCCPSSCSFINTSTHAASVVMDRSSKRQLLAAPAFSVFAGVSERRLLSLVQVEPDMASHGNLSRSQVVLRLTACHLRQVSNSQHCLQHFG